MALSQDDLQAIATIMDAKLDPVKMEIAEMKTEITGIKSDITSMKTEITGIKSDITSMKSEITGMKSDIEYLKYQMRKSERLILDEVERVHEILDRHIKDTSRHTA